MLNILSNQFNEKIKNEIKTRIFTTFNGLLIHFFLFIEW